MSSNKPETDALTLLRAIFDLGDADMRVTLDLLARLGGHSRDRAKSLLSQLRRAKLVQETGMGLTMVGLAAAVALPEFEPCREPARRGRPGLRAA
ncbi:MAG: hypothetical protein ACE37F_11030 [Nannocystaceae bacterium]|nr:hypothetical protein [bacterium]